jgi:hypothetical protein
MVMLGTRSKFLYISPMSRRPESIRPKEPDLTPRQRWIAAQRLAAGDTIRLAAVMVNTNSVLLSLLLAEDPEFQGLIEDCRSSTPCHARSGVPGPRLARAMPPSGRWWTRASEHAEPVPEGDWAAGERS